MAGSSARNAHAPVNPSGLRQSFTLGSPSPPRETLAPQRSPSTSPQPSPHTRPAVRFDNSTGDDLDLSRAGPSEQDPLLQPTAALSERTSLLRNVLNDGQCVHPGLCNHGTFSPRPCSPAASMGSSGSGFDSTAGSSNQPMPILDGLINSLDGSRDSAGWRRSLVQIVRSKKMSSSNELAERHGLSDTGLMCVPSPTPLLLSSALVHNRPTSNAQCPMPFPSV